MAYFTIMTELRGCYSDNDSAFTIRADTRRELKAALEGAADGCRDAGAIGLSKRAVAGLAAMTWRNRAKAGPYPYVLPWRYPYQDRDFMGLFVHVVTRRDYLDAESAYE